MTNKKYFIPISFAIIVLVSFFLPYYNIFGNRELSIKAEDWGSFGNYLGGIIGIINLGFFIYISILLSNKDEERSKIEIKTQKLITLTQFRQDELEKLTIEFAKLNDYHDEKTFEKMVFSYTYPATYLNSFLNQKSNLFPFVIDNENIAKLRIEFTKVCLEISDTIRDSKGELLNQEGIDKLYKLLNTYRDVSTNIIHNFQVYIVSELK